jgi:cardiolipin synthase A/B
MPPPISTPAVAATASQPLKVENAKGPVSAARGQQIVDQLKTEPGTDGILDRHMKFENAVNGSPLVTGNAVTLLQDGEATYRAMFKAIDGAKRHINLESYILQDDETGQRFADALIAKRRQGLLINVMHDGVGTLETPETFFDRLRAAGIQVVNYNPVNPLKAKAGWDVNERDHRKLLVVDGEIAFLGGINISAVYSGSSPGAKGGSGRSKAKTGDKEEERRWRDTHLRIEGPVVTELQKSFLEVWATQKGPPLDSAAYLPTRREARGQQVVRAIASSPNDSYSPIYATLISSIEHAEKRIWIMMAYFVPDPQLMAALSDAARRGVEVKLILPRHSDAKLVQSAGRAQYGLLLESGVQIYERREVLLHAKTAVIDGVWSTVGSANLDWRSFVHNLELNAVVLGTDFAGQMEQSFERDLAVSDKLTLEAWKQRPLTQRFSEWLGQLFQYWL